jgi:branched-chain amino acid transport system ATP-binding protein
VAADLESLYKMLNISELTSGYGPVEVIHNLSLNVNQGEIVAILGPNGAGKSTLLKTIVGLISPQNGAIVFQDRPIDRQTPERVLEWGIALVPEGRRVFSGLTVLENLRMGAYLERDAVRLKNRIDDAFDLFPRLKERRRQLAGTLSGGEQQQLAIARALMSRPKMLLLDEPSLGLAPVIVEVVIDLINSLRKDGLTIILVEQNIHQALEISDRAYVLVNGSIRMSGNTDQLLETGLNMEKAYLGEKI